MIPTEEIEAAIAWAKDARAFTVVRFLLLAMAMGRLTRRQFLAGNEGRIALQRDYMVTQQQELALHSAWRMAMEEGKRK